MTTLTDRDLAILAFEAGRWNYPGARDQAIRERFDLTPTRYAQIVSVLIDKPEALAADPTLVKRLRRQRDRRRRPVDPYPR